MTKATPLLLTYNLCSQDSPRCYVHRLVLSWQTIISRMTYFLIFCLCSFPQWNYKLSYSRGKNVVLQMVLPMSHNFLFLTIIQNCSDGFFPKNDMRTIYVSISLPKDYRKPPKILFLCSLGSYRLMQFFNALGHLIIGFLFQFIW